MSDSLLAGRFLPVATRSEEDKIGSLVALKGPHATLSGHVGPGDEQARCSIGTVLAIRQGDIRTVGLVREVSVNPSDWNERTSNHVNFEIELIGEIRDNAAGRPIFFRGVRTYPEMGSTASLIELRDLAAIYTLSEDDGVRVGSLTLRDDIPAMVSVSTLVSRHFAVVGSSGVGKTTAAAMLISNCLANNDRLHTLILDPHNEYRTHFNDAAVVLNSENLDLPFWLLRYDELADIIYPGRLPTAEEADALFEAMTCARIAYATQSKATLQSGLVRRQPPSDIINMKTNISADTPLPYRISDIQKVIDDWTGLLERPHSLNTLRTLRSRLEALSRDPRYRCMFGKTMVADNMVEVISTLFRIPHNGRPVTILELGGLPNEVVNALVSVIGRLAFDISFMSGGAQNIMLICEEGHRYVPRDPSLGFRPTRLALGRIAKEGRKYGVSLGVISQRPAEIDTTLLSQCSTIFAMRLPNEADQSIIEDCLPAYSASLSELLSALIDREAIAFGEAIATPMRMTFANHDTGGRPHDSSAAQGRMPPQENIARIVARLRGETQDA